MDEDTKDFIKRISALNQNPNCQGCDRDGIYGWKTASKWKKENERLNPKENKLSRDDKSNYYDAGSVETIEIIKAKLTHEQYIGYLLGQVLKYACRLNFKGHKSRDSEKLANYAAWLRDEITDHCSNFDYRLDDQKAEDGLMTAAGEGRI